MTCKKHPFAVIRSYQWGTVCMECRRETSRRHNEFSRVKNEVKRMGWLEGLEKC